MSQDIAAAPFLPSQVPAKPFAIDPPEMTRLRRMVEDHWSLTDEARERRKQDRRMYDGHQLSPSVRAVLKRRGQPEVVDNLIRPAINGLLGVLEASRTDPRAYPRNAQDQASADVATKGLRFAADQGKFDTHKLTAAKEYFIKGTACVLVEAEPDGPITYTPISYDEFVYDPHAKRLDFADAKYLGTMRWFYATDVQAAYPERWAALGDPFEVGTMAGMSTLLADKPEDAAKWVDKKQRRLLVAEIYYRDGGRWIRCVYCAAGVFEHAESAYLDDKGRTRCPFIAVSYEIDDDNERYGHVKDMVTLQHETNARRSRLLHLSMTRQVQQTDPAAQPVDSALVRVEASKPDGVIPSGWQVVPTVDLANGQSVLLTDSRQALQRMGPTPAVLGRQEGASQSGRARLVLQQAGMTELSPALGGIEEMETRCYEATWFCMKQFWNAPKWIRVTDEVRAPEFIQVNEPVQGMTMQPMAGPDGQPIVDPATGQPAMMPAAGVVGYNNRLADMDMDIIIGTTPERATLEAETFEELVKLTGGNLQLVLAPEFELMLEVAPLADKTRILELLKAKRKEAEESQVQQLTAMVQQLQAQLQAKADEAQARTAKTAAEVDKISAETERTEAETLIRTQEHLSGALATDTAQAY